MQSFISALHLRGHYSTKEFFRLLTKFGIQKTDQHRPDDTFGYIYGNITLDCPTNNCSLTKNILFLILDYDYFVPVFKKQRTQSCSDMMKQIQSIAFHRQCNNQGTEDFWRRIPCEQGQLCSDEDQPNNVIHNQQFTFKIRDINQPRFAFFIYYDTKSYYKNLIRREDPRLKNPIGFRTDMQIPGVGIQQNLLVGFDQPLKLAPDTNSVKLAISSRDRS